MAALESPRDGARVVFGITGISGGDDEEEEDYLLVRLRLPLMCINVNIRVISTKIRVHVQF